MRNLLRQAQSELATEQARLESVIVQAKALLARATGADAFIADRFERRLSNIMAVHAANILTVEQIRLGDGVLSAMLDRLTDVETLLFPLWQRTMLALAQADAGRRRGAADEFAGIHAKLISFLKQDQSR